MREKATQQANTLVVPFMIIFVGAFVLIVMGAVELIEEDCGSEVLVPESSRSSDCAFLFMLSSNAYFPCLCVAVHSLQMTGTQKDIIVFVTPNIWPSVVDALGNLNVIITPITAVKNPNSYVKRNHMRDNFTKLRAWQLTNYQKIVYSDSDFIYTQNSDDLCYLPADVNAGRNFVSLEGEWTDPDFFNAGFMVITPGTETFCDMIEASQTFVSPTGGDQPFQNMYWKDKWTELDYKYDGANANIYFTQKEEWNPKKIRSIHFTRATNPCNHKFERKVRAVWDEFEQNGRPDDHPMVLWLNAYEALLEEHPQMQEIFNQCGFMMGWDDGGRAFGAAHSYLGFI